MHAYLALVDSRVVVVGSFNDEVPVVGFGRMKDLDSLISCVNIMSVGQDVKVPSSYERYLQREESVGMIRMWRRRRRRKEGHLLKSCLLLDNFTPQDKYIVQKYMKIQT